MGQKPNTVKILEFSGFTVYKVITDKRKIKTLTTSFFKNSPKEICTSEETIDSFTTKNKDLLETLLASGNRAYFFFNRGDGKIFIRQPYYSNGILHPTGNISVHQISKPNTFIEKGTLLFIPM